MAGTMKTTAVGFFLLLILAALLMALAPNWSKISFPTVSYAQSHGIEKHQDSAVSVRQCMDKNGPLQTWFNPTTNRIAYICQVAPNVFGVQIVEQGTDGVMKEITAFVKNKMTRIEQVMKSMENAGYVQMQ